MSVLSYLQGKASGAVLSEAERTSINTSISTLAGRLDSYFTVANDGLTAKIRFGSHTRGTILPRKLDTYSDIDYMIVFEKAGYTPQTYLDRLKRFSEKYYYSSQIYQSSPTVVLELNHIKFDLVPALHQWGTSYHIPSGPGAWQSTNPNDFNSSLEGMNGRNHYLIKPTIRLMKIWNASNNYIYNSFLLEKWIINQAYYNCQNQKDYLLSTFDKLQPNTAFTSHNTKITRAKERVALIRQYERNDMPYSAESEAKKLIPE